MVGEMTERGRKVNIVIITGASSGLGREFAKQIDSNLGAGIDQIWLIARRIERLE